MIIQFPVYRGWSFNPDGLQRLERQKKGRSDEEQEDKCTTL
ncbi:MAG: hypothetical protein H6Q31_1601 [Bacteroidetes bacterium]|nr:hypothetical protein [Bacteroidota bacterium]